MVKDDLEKDYPLLHAVARASLHVERHKPVVVRLHYVGAGEKKDSLFFAGKVGVNEAEKLPKSVEST